MTHIVMVMALTADSADNGSHVACMFGAPAPKADRDNSGTTTGQRKGRHLQTAVATGVADGGSSEAEREGFEPSVHLRAHRFSRPARSAALAPLRRENKIIAMLAALVKFDNRGAAAPRCADHQAGGAEMRRALAEQSPRPVRG